MTLPKAVPLSGNVRMNGVVCQIVFSSLCETHKGSLVSTADESGLCPASTRVASLAIESYPVEPRHGKLERYTFAYSGTCIPKDL